ncbi:hypothetical protein GQ53DRAFT_755546 [Thozetella sp. PMI_491]|nr:hypothetical protein GQ53DRAFT_755546 [Thozetella sp. PMI_491]
MGRFHRSPYATRSKAAPTVATTSFRVSSSDDDVESLTDEKVNINSPVPLGYKYLSKGTHYITMHCRKRTRAAGKKVYVVRDPKKPKRSSGIRIPRAIYAGVLDDFHRTHHVRTAAMQRREEKLKLEFQAATNRLYPRMPPEDVAQMISHSLCRFTRRIGRTTLIGLDSRVKFAVVAHIRHNHTDYDKLLKSKVQWPEARKQIKPVAEKILKAWAKEEDPQKEALNSSVRQQPNRSAKIEARTTLSKCPLGWEAEAS